MIFYNNNIIIGVHNIIIMGANSLVVGDRFPSHSDDYTTPHRTCISYTRYLLNFPRTRTSWARNPIFFPSTVSVYQTISSLSLSSGRPSFSGRRRVLISLITIYGTENNDTRRRRLLHTRSRTTNSSGGVRGASWCRARALLFITRLQSVQCVWAYIIIIILYIITSDSAPARGEGEDLRFIIYSV